MRYLRVVRLRPAGILLAVVTALAAQDHSPSSPPAGDPTTQGDKPRVQAPLVRSTANLVVLDVVVTHNAHAVKGLQQQAFHVFEDAREQTIKVFEEHGPGSESEKPFALPSNTYTNAPELSGSAINVLLLDAVNTPFEDQAYARRKILEYLKTVPPGTRMAIFTLGTRLRLVKGFTSDSTELLAALARSVPTQTIPLAVNRGESAAERFAAVAVNTDQNQAGQSALDTIIQSVNQFAADEDVDLIDRRVQITLEALKQLALYLGALPGRKNVIWFSASFPLSLTPESPLDPFKSLHAYGPQLQQLSDLMTASRVAVYPVDARGLITTAPPASQNRPAAIAIGSGRTGMIDPNAFPSAPAEGDRNAELATMLLLAEQTGGTAFYNNNALNQAIVRAVENGASYYTLTYSTDNKNFDGKFRKIQVKLSGHNYTVAYRHGYFADGPAAHGGNALLSLASPGLRPDAPPSSEILFHARVLGAGDPSAQGLQPQPGQAGDLAAKLKPPVRRYWIEYTADMRQVSTEIDSNGFYRSSLEFIVIAYDHDGKLVNANRRAVKLGIPATKYDEVLRSGYSTRNELDLPEGEVWLRLAVHDVSADRIGSIEVPLRIVSRQAE